jgi:hypothetical protein
MRQFYRILLLVVAFAAALNISIADVYKYEFESAEGTYSEITTGTVHGDTGNDDDVFDNIDIGFTFTFDCTDYTQVGIACNGFLKFGTGITNDFYPISNAWGYDNYNLVSGLGWDLQAQSDAELRTQTSGTAPNRVFTAQWKNYRYYGSSGESYNFQIKLYEGSNKIEIVYGSFTVAEDEQYEVGLNGASDSDYNNRSVVSGENTWATSDAGGSNEAYCQMSSSLEPDDTYSCLVYSWELKNQSYESSDVEQVAGYARIGDTDVAVIRVAVEMFGSESPLNITDMAFSTNGTTNTSDISNAKVYYTGASTDFDATTQFGTAVASPDGNFTISGIQELRKGTNYFWLTYDLPAGATSGNEIDAECNSLTIGGTDYIPTTIAPTGERTIYASLTGTYDVGTGGDFATFEEAFDVINVVGLQGNTILKVVSDITESDQAYLGEWDEYGGTGYSLTIRPDGQARSIRGDFDYALLYFEEVSNLVLDGSLTEGGSTRDLTLSNNGESDGGTGSIVVLGGSGIDIKNIKAHNGDKEIGFDILLSGADDVTIDNCQLYKADYGIYTQNTCTDISIINNEIGSGTSSDKLTLNGIFISYTDGFTIKNNEIHGIYHTGGESIMGINVSDDGINGEISLNKVHSLQNTTGACFGIWVGVGDDHPDVGYDCDVDVINNMVYNLKADASYTIGLVASRVSNVMMYHNSIHLDGSGTTGAITCGLFCNPEVDDLEFKHNIIEMNLPATYPMAVYVNPSTNPFDEIDYNCYSVGATGTTYIGYFGGFQSTLSDWQDAIDDDDYTTTTEPTWVGDNDLHLSGTAINDSDFMVTKLTDVGTDIDGEDRRATTYIGADEVIPVLGFTTDITTFATPFCDGEMIEMEGKAEVTGFEDGVSRSINPPIEYAWYQDGTLIDGATEDSYTIDPASEDNEGTYQMKATFSEVEVYSGESFVEVQQPIDITAQPPARADLCEGNSTLNISVEATGTIIGYQWQQEVNPGIWSDLEGQTATELSMPIENAEDARGNYRVIVYGPGNCGPDEVISDITQVFVSVPLTGVHAVYEFDAANVCKGDNIKIKAEAEGTILGYQWQVEQGGTFRDIDGTQNPTAWSNTLEIQNAQPYQSGTYRCLVFGSPDCNTEEIPTEAIDITIWPLVTIDEQPQSELICEGGDVLLSVVGNGIIHGYQWQKDGMDLPVEDYPMANQPIFELNNISYGQSGAYRCVMTVEDCQGVYELPSDVAVVHVLRETEITEAPVTKYAAIGGSAEFRVKAHAEGAPEEYKVDVQWYRGTMELQNGDRIQGVKSSILTISDINSGDIGEDYRVVVQGLCGTAEADGFGLLNPGAEITQQPADAELCEGESATFSIEANLSGGATSMQYQWWMGSTKLTDDGHFEGVTTNSLKINDITIFDESEDIYCELIIQPGDISVFSDPVELTVKEIPVILGQSGLNQDVEAGKDLELEVVADGYQPLTYQWYKDGTEIPGATSATLTRTDVAAADAGTYVCYVSNECATAMSEPIVVSVTTGNVSSVDENIAALFTLGINEPNPFDSKTMIRFSLEETAFVRLVVTDMNGREVARLASESMPAGDHRVDFNSRDYDLPSGVYYYTLTAGGVSKTRSMVIAK